MIPNEFQSKVNVSMIFYDQYIQTALALSVLVYMCIGLGQWMTPVDFGVERSKWKFTV